MIRSLSLSFLVFVAVVLVLMAHALAAARLGSLSGFAAYGSQWEMNAPVFTVFKGAAQTLPQAFGLSLTDDAVRLAARGMAGAVLLGIIVFLMRRPLEDGRNLCSRALVIVAALFLLSPTQFPWYVIWFIPLLAVRPQRSLLLLTVLLPFYYLRFHFEVRGAVEVFDRGVVWLEFAPVWLLLAAELFQAKHRQAGAMTERAA